MSLRRFSAIGTTAFLLTANSLVPSSVLAIPTPGDPADPAYQEQWANSAIRPVDQDSAVSIEVLSAPTQANLGEDLVLQLRLSNNSDQDFNSGDLIISTRRAPATESVAQTRETIAGTPENYPYFAAVHTVEQSLNTGESLELELRIPTDANTDGGLSIATVGSYPIFIGLQSTQNGLLDSQRFALRMGEATTAQAGTTDEPTASSATGSAAATNTQPTFEAEASAPVGTQMLIPLTTTIDIVPGETGTAPERADLILKNDNFVAELRENGRLGTLINEYATAVAASPKITTATCFAIDPQLIDVLDRMSEGYYVGQQRPEVASQNQRLRDSWGSSDTDVNLTAGENAELARTWLNQLREVVQDACVVALPWANTDINAIGATGNPWLIREALQRGPGVLKEVLGVTPVANTVVSGSGYVTENAVASLGWADISAEAQDLSKLWEKTRATELPLGDHAENLTSLEDTRRSDERAQAPVPENPIHILVADNTVWGTAQAGRFAELAPNIQAVTYPGSLAATLAEVGQQPLTMGYSNSSIRFDYTLDSPAARTATAVAALYQTIDVSTDPVLISLPSLIDDISPFIAALGDLLDSNVASAVPFHDYVYPDAAATAALADANAEQDERGGEDLNSHFGAPYEDPTVVGDTELMDAKQQAAYADDLTDLLITDPAIALTPYNFTAGLRRDILRALNVNRRQSRSQFQDHIENLDSILDGNRTTLVTLRSSVNLIPPGNVYTRTSTTAPLLIAARNGLPLPVDAQLSSSGPEGTTIDAGQEHIIIPARGSLTLQMTADIPNSSERTDLELWLSNQSGEAITTPVAISVQTRTGIAGLSFVAIALFAGLIGLLAFRLIRQVHAHRSQNGVAHRTRRRAQRKVTKKKQTHSTQTAQGKQREKRPPQRRPRRQPPKQ
ncbi:MAG: hypothetical protein Q3976_03710 [Corynebacterium sp.]|nr:hypothetical protein [Corynebacterium sp.]